VQKSAYIIIANMALPRSDGMLNYHFQVTVMKTDVCVTCVQCWICPLVTTAWRVLGLQMDGWPPAMEGSRGQTTRDGPPSGGVGRGSNNPSL
jgi:hypothetical protein